MTFTDDDLKQLKNGMSALRMTIDVSEYSLGANELEALLARLEASETRGDWHSETACGCKRCETWRKATGKGHSE